MYDLITLGDITIDLFFKGNTLTLKDNRFYLAIGGKYSAEYFYESLGGGGANVAVGAAKFGLDTAIVGTIGENAFKQMIIQKLTKKTVSCEFLNVEKDHLNLSSILLTEEGERTIIHYRTPEKRFLTVNNLMPQSLKTHIIYMGNLSSVPKIERKKLLALFKKNGALTCLNLGSTDCRDHDTDLDNLIGETDIFFINTYEFAELIGKKKETIDFSKNCVRFLNLDNKIIILTDGKNGSFLYHQNKIYHQKAITPKQIVDTTGAGDAYISAFLAFYHKENNFQKAMFQGASYAAEIIGRMGAQ